ncbi:MAG: Alpha-galactosidase, partial [Actinomycetota bacterium]
RLALEHPEWLLHDVSAGSNWNQSLRVLDIARPAAADHLSRVIGELSGLGFDYFKLDFLYAGALSGGAGGSDSAALESYREGLRLVREAAGPDAFIVGCGAPTVASVGLVDAMRISPDIATHVDPANGDLSAPALRSALFSGNGRAWQNRTLWWADPDCLIARPEMPEREAWAAWVTSVAGLRSISDDLGALDEAGLSLIRDYLSDL